jgi:partner of Y14 and mago protein
MKVPEEEPLYVSKRAQMSERSKYPVGLSDADFAPSSGASGVGSGGNVGSAGYFEVGQYEQARVIPGLNFVESGEDEAKKKKKKPKGKPAEVVENGKQAPASIGTKSQPAAPAAAAKAPSKGQETDPNKRLRNLRKKLKDIETLEVKLKTGELQNPDPDQLEKVKRKKAVIDEIDELVGFISSMNL